MRQIDPLTASVLGAAGEGALLLDGDGRVLHANARAAELLARTTATLAGAPFDLPVAVDALGADWTAVDGGSGLEASASPVGLEPRRTVVWLRRRTAGAPDASATIDELEALTGVGRWTWWPGEERLEWSRELHRIYGTTPGDVVPSVEQALAVIHPLDRDRAARAVDGLGREGRLEEPLRNRIVRPDGEVRTLVATTRVAQLAPDGAPVRLEGWMQDVTEAAGRQRLRRVARAARGVLERWRGTTDAPVLLAEVGEALEAAFCVLWLPRQTLLHAEATWCAAGFDGGAFEVAVRRARVARYVGYAGRAWSTGEPVRADDPPPLQRTRAALRARDVGLHGGVAIPARTDHHVAAVLSVHTCEAGELTGAVVGGLGRIGEELAREVDRVARAQRAELSPRELEVLARIADGRPTPTIAEDLGISTATVRTHVEHVLAKLGARDRAAAVASAMRAGLLV